jgi:hypothetical protein
VHCARLIVPVLLAVTALASAGAPDASGQVRASTCLAPTALANGSFEQPQISGAVQVPQDRLGGWLTTAADGNIELWRSGVVAGIPAAAGNQLTELAGTQSGTATYQDIATTPGALLAYAFSHRGRTGTDTMELRLGPPGGPVNLTRQVSTGSGGWQQVIGSYPVPAGQTVTRIAFQWVRNSAGDASSTGNLLDGVVVSTTTCGLTVTKALSPAADTGRFDLLAGDQVIAAGAGAGGTSGPLPMPLSSVQVSERAAAGTDLAGYASAIMCRDTATGELVAEAAAPEVTVNYETPRQVACQVFNVRTPAVVLEKVLYPPEDPGRFELRVGEQTVAAAAGDGTVAGPVAVAVGPVEVSERPDSATRALRYASSVQCFEGLRRRRFAAAEQGTSATVQAQPGSLIGCVLLNVAARAPDPKPPDPEPAPEPSPAPGPPSATPVPAQAGGDGEIDLVVRAVAARRRVPAGSPARLRVRVSNRGSLPASGVRLVLAARQAGLRSRRLSVSMPRRVGPCVDRRGLALCYAKRIAPGATVTLKVSAGTRRLPSTLRLVAVADADEPERVVRNNVDRARVRLTRPPSRPCASAARGPVARAAC